jgi:hypothetical protein
MRYCALILAVVAAATAARAQDAIPDLKGTWSGKGKVIIFGGHAHHPGVSGDSPPTVRDIEMTLLVEGQDGRLAWGRSSSANADIKEPFAWAMSSSRSSAPIPTVPSASPCSLPTAWRSATPTTASARANRSSRAAT